MEYNQDDVLEVKIMDDQYILDLSDDFMLKNSIDVDKHLNCGKTYDITGEYGIGYTSNTHREFYFDLDDFETINEYIWYEYINKETGYHSLRTRDKSRKSITMTTLLGCKFYDHIDRNPLNCRRNNLRPATQKQNTRNRTKMKNNTSGVTGVYWDKRSCVWVATIGVDYKHIRLGSFKNKDDAIKARLEAEIKYYGKFAPQIHLFEKYNINTKGEDYYEQDKTSAVEKMVTGFGRDQE